MSIFKEYWRKIKGDDSHLQGTIAKDAGLIHSINTDADKARLNLLVLKRVASEIFSAIIRTQQGTMVASIASLAQSAISAKISFSLLQAQAAGAFALGQVPQALALEALAFAQLQLSTQASMQQFIAEQNQRSLEAYTERVNDFREMYS